ncbi:AraC family transcriptional regulator [Flammeovirga sp. EKP202]|uniref:helix-turn-helix domain-containing protein n=1 Tax=Flammeovirga sp. EKP202 TaxID=2770592 RepID=UPI0016600447|nr:AraC family transcriptional regulator [Flammeovirga sp. EKP202]MBD0401408.1 helix-turn-helix transcriptional regulator [Flammeovirga sp. EKP202]
MVRTEGSEESLDKVFQAVSDKYNGNWDGEEMSFTSEEGYIEVISLRYLNDFIVGTQRHKLTDGSVWKRKKMDRKYITIRLGSHSDRKERSKGTTPTEGIFIYNSYEDLTFNYPKNHSLEWMVISIPYDKFKLLDIFPNDSVLMQMFEMDTFLFHYMPMTFDIELLIRSVFDIRKDKLLRKPLFLSKAFEILGRLNSKMTEQETLSQNLHPQDLELMLDLKVKLLEDYTIQPNLDNIASDLGMSKSKLQRSFKSVFNTSILKYFNTQRLEEARRKIEFTDDSLSYISYDLGFNDISHFSTAFRKHFGVAPSDIR